LKSSHPPLIKSKHKFRTKLNVFNVIMGVSRTMYYFLDFCDHNGLVFRFSSPHTSFQNDKTKHKIWTIKNMIQTLLAHSSVPPSFCIMPFKWSMISLIIYFLRRPCLISLPLNFYIIVIPLIHIYDSLVAFVILFPLSYH